MADFRMKWWYRVNISCDSHHDLILDTTALPSKECGADKNYSNIVFLFPILYKKSVIINFASYFTHHCSK